MLDPTLLSCRPLGTRWWLTAAAPEEVVVVSSSARQRSSSPISDIQSWALSCYYDPERSLTNTWSDPRRIRGPRPCAVEGARTRTDLVSLGSGTRGAGARVLRALQDGHAVAD